MHWEQKQNEWSEKKTRIFETCYWIKICFYSFRSVVEWETRRIHCKQHHYYYKLFTSYLKTEIHFTIRLTDEMHLIPIQHIYRYFNKKWMRFRLILCTFCYWHYSICCDPMTLNVNVNVSMWNVNVLYTLN